MSDATTTAGLGLKVGDEAVIRVDSIGGTSFTVTKIAKVSPTGRLTDGIGNVWNADGKPRGSFRYCRRIMPLDDEIRAKMADDAERSRLRVIIHNWATGRVWRDLSTADLRRIAELIAEIDGEVAQPEAAD